MKDKLLKIFIILVLSLLSNCSKKKSDDNGMLALLLAGRSGNSTGNTTDTAVARVSGILKDSSGNVLANATLSVSNATLNALEERSMSDVIKEAIIDASVKTDSNGLFTLNLGLSKYTIVVTKSDGTSGGSVVLTITSVTTNGTTVSASSGVNVTVINVSSTSTNTSSAYIVTTVAGSGNIGAKDGSGTAALFSYAYEIAVDSSANLYVADTNNNKIRKITSTGVVTTLAGSGNIGATDGSGTAASFNFPRGIAVDSTGNVYVADTNNFKIRKITPTGVVSTFAGSGITGSTDGTNTNASFGTVYGIAVDADGNIYVADTNKFKIRKITSSGVVSTFAGSGIGGSVVDGTGTAASFSSPSGVAVDSSGSNIYVSDTNARKIRKITSSGVVTTFAGSDSVGPTDGTGTSASFGPMHGIAVDSIGNIYVADTGENKIRKITSLGVVTTIAGSGSKGSTDGIGTSASFSNPHGIAVDSAGNVYVTDTYNFKIRKLSTLSL